MKKLLLTAVAVAASVASFTAVAQSTTVTPDQMKQILDAHDNVQMIQTAVKATLAKTAAANVDITSEDIQAIQAACSGDANKCSAVLRDRQHKKVGLAGKTPLSVSDVAKLQALYAAGDAAGAAGAVNEMVAARTH